MSFLRLQYTRSDGEVDTYHLKSGRRYNVGRGSACEVRILDMRLSRKHCAFEDKDGTWILSDLGSTNGCRINKERVYDDIPIPAETTITLGSVEIFVASIKDNLEGNSADSARNATVVVDDEDEQENNLSPESQTAVKASEPEVEVEEKAEEVEKEKVPKKQEPEKAIEVPQEKVGKKEVPEEAPSKAKEKSEKDNEYEPSTSSLRLDSIQSQPEETKTVFISALGRKVGPITRTQARELKKRELKGQLTEKELGKIIGDNN